VVRTFIDYVLSTPCPTCKAPAWQHCDAPAKQRRHEGLRARSGGTYEPETDVLQHATRWDRAARHKDRDVVKAPWREDREPGRTYHTIDYSGRPEAT
jgi:hypothetical protein